MGVYVWPLIYQWWISSMWVYMCGHTYTSGGLALCGRICAATHILVVDYLYMGVYVRPLIYQWWISSIWAYMCGHSYTSGGLALYGRICAVTHMPVVD